MLDLVLLSSSASLFSVNLGKNSTEIQCGKPEGTPPKLSRYLTPKSPTRVGMA